MNKKNGIILGAVAIVLLMVSTPLMQALNTIPVTTSTTITRAQQLAVRNPSDISTADVIKSVQIIKADSNNPIVKIECQQAISYLSNPNAVRKYPLCTILDNILRNIFENTTWGLLENVTNDWNDDHHLTFDTWVAIVQYGLDLTIDLFFWWLLHCANKIGPIFEPSSSSVASQLIAPFVQPQSSTSVCSLCATTNN